MVGFDSDGVGWNGLVFLSDELPSEAQSIGVLVLLVLLILLHDVGVVGVVSILICHLKLVALVHALRGRSLLERASL